MKAGLRATAGRALRLALLGTATLAMVGLAGWAAVGTHFLAQHPCDNNSDPLGRPISTLFVLGALSAFVLGRVLGHHRDFRNEADLLPRAGEPLVYQRRSDRASLLLHISVAVFLLLVVALLSYETWAFWLPDPSPRWPITSFVRCADRTHTVPALAAAWTAAFLAGHWLWHPLRRQEED